MASILDGDIAASIADALTSAAIPLDVTVRRTTVTGVPWDPSSQTTTITDYPAQGWPDVFSAEERDGTLIQVTDTKVMVIVGSLAIEPTTADKVIVRGKTLNIIAVSIDPARALWTLQARA